MEYSKEQCPKETSKRNSRNKRTLLPDSLHALMDYFAQFQAKNADLIVSEWKAQSPKRLSGQDEESIEDFLEYLWHWLESHSETLVETKGNLASKNWSPKSEQAAQVWRERGNEEFKKKSFKSAREFYTKVRFSFFLSFSPNAIFVTQMIPL